MPFWKKSEDPWDYEPEKPSRPAEPGQEEKDCAPSLMDEFRDWIEERKEKKALRETPPPPMICPWCGQEMEVGTITGGRDSVQWWPGWPNRFFGASGPEIDILHEGSLFNRYKTAWLPQDGDGNSGGGDPQAPDVGESGGAAGGTAAAGGPAEDRPWAAGLRIPPGGGDRHQREGGGVPHKKIHREGENRQMAQLYFKYGAMGSSKTANALMTRFNYEERGQKTLLVKPRLDTRDGDHMVVSRIGLTYPCIYFDEMQQLSVMELQQNACVIVDEAQFLTREEVMYLVGLVDDLGIPVICYGLRADFKGDLFPGSEALLVMADKIEEVKTICWCGKKATFNARFDAAGKVLKEGEQVVLGANDQYIGLCRKHWMAGDLGPDFRPEDLL